MHSWDTWLIRHPRHGYFCGYGILGPLYSKTHAVRYETKAAAIVAIAALLWRDDG